MSIQIRTGVIRVEVGDNKPLYDTHFMLSAILMITALLLLHMMNVLLESNQYPLFRRQMHYPLC